MATMHADASGIVLRWLPTAALEAQYPVAPTGTASSLTFDQDTNASLAADLTASTDLYRLNGSTLTKDGQAVVVAADGQDKSDRDQIDAAIASMTTFIGTANGSLDLAAVRAQTKIHARILRLMLRKLRAQL